MTAQAAKLKTASGTPTPDRSFGLTSGASPLGGYRRDAADIVVYTKLNKRCQGKASTVNDETQWDSGKGAKLVNYSN